MSTHAAMNFDTPEHVVIVIPVTLPAPNAGKKFTLREANGATTLAYKATQAKGAKMVDKTITSEVIGILESEYVLVGGCLHTEDGAEPRPVGTDFAKTLPQRIVSELYEAAKKISKLDNQPKTEADWVKAMHDARAGLMEHRKVQGTIEANDPKALPADSTPGS